MKIVDTSFFNMSEAFDATLNLKVTTEKIILKQTVFKVLRNYKHIFSSAKSIQNLINVDRGCPGKSWDCGWGCDPNSRTFIPHLRIRL